MAELFQVAVSTVNEHVKGVYGDAEVVQEATIRKFRIVRFEGTREVARTVDHYSLPVILAVGYRVRSPRGTQFRQWATARLEEYLIKGFVLDDERLKNPPGPGVPDYAAEYARRGWTMFEGIDRVYDNAKARAELGWRPKVDFARVIARLRESGDIRSPLARAVGAKGYHR